MMAPADMRWYASGNNALTNSKNVTFASISTTAFVLTDRLLEVNANKSVLSSCLSSCSVRIRQSGTTEQEDGNNGSRGHAEEIDLQDIAKH